MLTQDDIKQENEKRLKEIQSRLALVKRRMAEACEQENVKEKQRRSYPPLVSRFLDPEECDIECNMVGPTEHDFKALAEISSHERREYYIAMHEVISKLKAGGLTHEQALKHVDSQAVMEKYSVHLSGEGFEGFTIDRNGYVIRFISHNCTFFHLPIERGVLKHSLQNLLKPKGVLVHQKQSLAPEQGPAPDLLRHKGVPVHEKKSFAPRS